MCIPWLTLVDGSNTINYLTSHVNSTILLSQCSLVFFTVKEENVCTTKLVRIKKNPPVPAKNASGIVIAHPLIFMLHIHRRELVSYGHWCSISFWYGVYILGIRSAQTGSFKQRKLTRWRGHPPQLPRSWGSRSARSVSYSTSSPSCTRTHAWQHVQTSVRKGLQVFETKSISISITIYLIILNPC